jgi:MFS transporter, ACS family, tartrate transporter
MSRATLAEEPIEFAERTRRKISRRLVPFLILLYTIAFLDRANLGYASLEMTKELYGFGAGVFFLGYWFLEIPGAIFVERWSARKGISRIMVSWGLAAKVLELTPDNAGAYTNLGVTLNRM